MTKFLTKFVMVTAAACVLVMAGVSLSGLGATTAMAQALDDPTAPTDAFLISNGGRLYDKWWNVLYAPEPEDTHPAYTADGTKSGSTTWRCKECHGWDYRGADGAYATGSHFTGIKGIRDFAGADPAAIVDILVGPLHGFTEAVLPRPAIDALALFVAKGQVDATQYINYETKAALGNASRGADLFQTICSVCHGIDGTDMNFGDEDSPLYVGTLANDNPWEILHKIRFGHPGAPMVAMFALDVQDQVDVLTYLQLLP
ncbi:MAG: hypothetical protein HOB82_08035 [Alphaproteobacteria bacterium]|jgi:hypothetical protein|nr:hypothetical protein [Alphaproteobacteria bacterium]